MMVNRITQRRVFQHARTHTHTLFLCNQEAAQCWSVKPAGYWRAIEDLELLRVSTVLSTIPQLPNQSLHYSRLRLRPAAPGESSLAGASELKPGALTNKRIRMVNFVLASILYFVKKFKKMKYNFACVSFGYTVIEMFYFRIKKQSIWKVWVCCVVCNGCLEVKKRLSLKRHLMNH